jgi:hypothetical protein
MLLSFKVFAPKIVKIVVLSAVIRYGFVGGYQHCKRNMLPPFLLAALSPILDHITTLSACKPAWCHNPDNNNLSYSLIACIIWLHVSCLNLNLLLKIYSCGSNSKTSYTVNTFEAKTMFG